MRSYTQALNLSEELKLKRILKQAMQAKNKKRINSRIEKYYYTGNKKIKRIYITLKKTKDLYINIHIWVLTLR